MVSENVRLSVEVFLPGGNSVSRQSVLSLEVAADDAAESRQQSSAHSVLVVDQEAAGFEPSPGQVSGSEPTKTRPGAWWRPLRFDQQTGSWQAEVPHGVYRLRGRLREPLGGSGWELPSVAFETTARTEEEEVALAIFAKKKGWMTFRYGDTWLSFEPVRGRLALAFEHDAPDAETAKSIAGQLSDLGLEPEPSPLASGAILLFRGPEDGYDPREIEERIRRVHPGSNPRAGVPIDLDPLKEGDLGVKVLDRRAYFRLAQKSEAAEAWLRDQLERIPGAEEGSELVEEKGLDGVFSAELPGRRPFEELAALQALNDPLVSPRVAYAEPDLVHQLTDCLAPSTSQENLLNQGVQKGWQRLDDAGLDPLGSREVRVTIFDTAFPLEKDGAGWRVDHPDAPADQIAAFYDCNDLTNGDQPAKIDSSVPHGLLVYGVIGADATNNLHIQGVSPRISIVLAERPRVASTKYYVQVLRWLSGHRSTRPDADGYSPAPGEPKTSKIICCAHTPNGPGASTFADWAREMRKDGIVLVYAAGNDNAKLKAKNGYAYSVNTIAVANASLDERDRGDVVPFKRFPSSNKGKRLDLAAVGRLAPALIPNSSLQFLDGGTSLAAATVSGAIALLRTQDPDADFAAIRNALRSSAKQNDDPEANWSGGRSHLYGSGLLNVEGALAVLDGEAPVT